MIGVLKNVGMAAAGVVVAEKLGSTVAQNVSIPGGQWGLPAAMALGGVYLGGKGGLLGKLGYGLALSGALHLVGAIPGAGKVVDINFEGGY